MTRTPPARLRDHRLVRWLGLACLVLVMVRVLAVWFINTWQSLHAPQDLSRVAFVGSDACRSCHPQHHESWSSTFHRTMTQQATPQTVLGNFDNAELQYGGITARMTTRDDQLRVTFSRGSERWSADVVRSVGSHRFQQYLARDRDVYFRLPVAWDVEEQRWMQMNGAFLTADPTPTSIGEAITRVDYDRHVTRWNDNCVFCHNVAPNPGLRESGEFATTTAEFGVACEACHGPGRQHAELNRSPLRRYALHLSTLLDPTIANPARMPEVRHNEVCGRCHGQRKAADLDRVLREGDTFVPGTALDAHSTPLQRDTTLNGEPDVFAARFWRDGTPRLTAYEYQGLLLSACAKGGELTCGSCHSMHDGDASLQLRRDIIGDELCTQCHTSLVDSTRAQQHSGHPATTPAIPCVRCHTPHIVYGLVDARISHRIESPNVTRNATDERPDACTLCHVDRTRTWATHTTPATPATSTTTNALTDDLPEVARALFGGDPIERAVAAAALGRVEDGSTQHDQRVTWLLDTLERDPYPAVRRIAWRSLRTLVANRNDSAQRVIASFDLANIDITARRAAVVAIATALRIDRTPTQASEAVARLRAQASQRDIEIGE